jgi:serine/threonine protein kinase
MGYIDLGSTALDDMEAPTGGSNWSFGREYEVGEMLGEGAFGVISKCTKRSTKEEFAVKIGKAQAAFESIKSEADVLAGLDHPNIVKFHGLFCTTRFVCIVMDKYCGGDLVVGIKRHPKGVDCSSSIHLGRQIAASIQYLHQRRVIHRDIKFDNYLMDRRDMTDPACKIALTDFGLACRGVSPSRVFRDRVGTKRYWAPEMYDKAYTVKVDVWAMGVIMYGILTGRFPFRGEADIRRREVKLPEHVHPVCQDYIAMMLHKSESERHSAEEVASHAWLNPLINHRVAPRRQRGLPPRAHTMPEKNASDRVSGTKATCCAAKAPCSALTRGHSCADFALARKHGVPCKAFAC